MVERAIEQKGVIRLVNFEFVHNELIASQHGPTTLRNHLRNVALLLTIVQGTYTFDANTCATVGN